VPEDRVKAYQPEVGREVIFGLRPEDIYNPDLKNFALLLKDLDADTGHAFWNLLDEALAKMDSGVPEDDPLFSVLIGRPLALMRAFSSSSTSTLSLSAS
jgi:hypothetical protein